MWDWNNINVLVDPTTLEASLNKFGADVFINEGAELLKKRIMKPYIKLYKVFPNEDKNKYYEIRFNGKSNSFNPLKKRVK